MKILFISALALLFIVFLFFSYPRIILLYTILTKGRYSAAYTSRYKKFFNKNPFGYCVKEDFIDRIFPFIKRNSKAISVKIQQSKLPTGHPFFTSFKKLRSEEGKPVCFQSYIKAGIDFKIIGYNTAIEGVKARVYYYFAGNLLFMTEFIVERASASTISELIQIITGNLSLNDKPHKYIYADISENEGIYIRDAAYSLVISHMNKDHLKIRRFLKTIDEEYSRIWNSLSQK